MGWKQYARQMEAERRRSERDEARWQKAQERRSREIAKQTARDQAAEQVAEADAYLDMIVNLHRECGERWNWKSVATQPAPSEPQRTSIEENAARGAADAYQPGFFEKLFGKAARKVVELETAIVHARERDDASFSRANEKYAARRAEWQEGKGLASGVVAGDPASWARALQYGGAYAEIEALGVRMSATIDRDAVVVRALIPESADLVPMDELKLTATGKVSEKKIAVGRYWALYQDHVCSAAIRIARETVAVLPTDRVIVNVALGRTNTSTGHPEVVTILAAHFTRAGLDGLRFAAIDPSDAMKNFPHRMKLKKTAGFEPVDPITLDENWVTTG